MREVRAALGILILVGILGALAFKVTEYRTRLTYLPEGFDAWRIVYAEERIHGFGPGGSDTGLVVFAMPEAMQEALARQGIGWLQALAGAGDRGRHGGFATWHSTPAGPAPSWSDPARCGRSATPAGSCPGIAVFLKRYGIRLPIRASVEQLTNRALFSSGAYWSEGHGALVVVIPEARRIVIAYSG